MVWKNIPNFAAEIDKALIMDKKNFRDYTDEEFKAALEATLNLKAKWLDSIRKREKELGLA